jgi:AraC-like DNA-binding protein
LAKIAENLALAVRDVVIRGTAGGLRSQSLVEFNEWSTEDVTCTAGPSDAPYEEQHTRFRIAIVAAGTFQCRSPRGEELFTTGSLLLGNVGEWFECGHAHGRGDRCLSFGYEPSYFERLAADAGLRRPSMQALRIPPLRELTPIVSRTLAEWECGTISEAAEELHVAVAAHSLRLSSVATRTPRAPPNAERAVTRAARLIDHDPAARLSLSGLARAASMSPYHFLRTFVRVTGLTPHQYVRRARLRLASVRLQSNPVRIVDVALECGFSDVSNFNRAFRTEFGMTPTDARIRLRRRLHRQE